MRWQKCQTNPLKKYKALTEVSNKSKQENGCPLNISYFRDIYNNYSPSFRSYHNIYFHSKNPHPITVNCFITWQRPRKRNVLLTTRYFHDKCSTFKFSSFNCKTFIYHHTLTHLITYCNVMRKYKYFLKIQVCSYLSGF